MLPLVLNEIPDRYVQINMQGSVGWGARNSPNEVKMIQSMLNSLPAMDGGPTGQLSVDGLVGPLTVGSITTFQRAARLRVADGRVDPVGPTIRALGMKLNAKNLMPRNVPGIGPVDRRIRQALAGGGITAPPRRQSVGSAPTQGFQPLGLTDWSFKSSGGGSLGAWILGVGAMNFYLEKDSRRGFIRSFPWSGIGAGLSVMPVGLDVSFESMPSFGLRLRQGMFNGANPMPEDDFVIPTNVFSVGASVGVGWSGTLVMWGAVGPIILPTRAIGAITGMEAGIPGAGITGYWGMTGPAV